LAAGVVGVGLAAGVGVIGCAYLALGVSDFGSGFSGWCWRNRLGRYRLTRRFGLGVSDIKLA